MMQFVSWFPPNRQEITVLAEDAIKDSAAKKGWASEGTKAANPATAPMMLKMSATTSQVWRSWTLLLSMGAFASGPFGSSFVVVGG